MNESIKTGENYCLARTNRELELFQLPFDTPSMLPAGVELLWLKAMDIVVFQGHSYQIKPTDRSALTLLSWDGSLSDEDLTAVQANDPKATQQEQHSCKSPPTARIDLELEDRIWVQLRGCYDPEIPVNIVELGLIYEVQIKFSGFGRQIVNVKMTLTNPACSMGDLIIQEIKDRVGDLPEVEEVVVELVFDPPWSYDCLSEQAKLELGLL